MEEILETLDNTLEKIKSFTKLALVSEAKPVVETWRGELSRRLLLGQDPLPLVYGCNDVLQESKGETHESFCTAFADCLEEEFVAILSHKPDLTTAIKKVVKIWSDRKVFTKNVLKKLKACLRQYEERSVVTEDAEDHDMDDRSDDGEDAATGQDPKELQRAALQALPAEKLLALLEWLKAEQLSNPSPDFQGLEISITQCQDALEATGIRTVAMQHLSDVLKEKTSVLKRRRRMLQANVPLHEAAKKGLEKAIQRIEDSMQHAIEDQQQSDVLRNALNQISEINQQKSIEAKYKSVRLIPKRQRVVQQVVQGPDLSFSRERQMQQGLTAEAAATANRPLIYNKTLQKWIPLPSGDDSDTWRD